MEIKGKTFVVTGAGQGLGQAISLQLAKSGANLALIDVNQQGLETSQQICIEQGARCSTYSANVASEPDVEACFRQIQTEYSSIHGLINNAGILRDGLLVKCKEGKLVEKLSLASWQSVIDVNLTGVFLCGREAASIMAEQDDAGVIINISSISRAGNPGQSNYAAAKAGVVALTTTWARELARFNIRCAAIAPGVFQTDMVASMKPEAHDRITSAIPLGRTGALEELASTVEFIVNNDYLNGRVIELDGGLRL